jgi:hypothetical protein
MNGSKKVSKAEESLRRRREKMMEHSKGVEEEFNRQYNDNCNEKTLTMKNRDVSPQSPFNKIFQHPIDYAQSEVSSGIAKNPTKLNPKEIKVKEMPLAGHLSEIG